MQSLFSTTAEFFGLRKPSSTEETEKTKIPWQVFLDAIPKQHPGYMETWLRGWAFNDAGPVQVEQTSRGGD